MHVGGGWWPAKLTLLLTGLLQVDSYRSRSWQGSIPPYCVDVQRHACQGSEGTA